MATILYACSGVLEQTPAHQRDRAADAGLKIDQVIYDDDISASRMRLAERKHGRRLLDTLRAGDTLVVRWIDCLGRDRDDIANVVGKFMQRGVIIRCLVDNFTFDGASRDPKRRAIRGALVSFLTAIAKAQTEVADMVQARQTSAYLGRHQSFTRDQLTTVTTMLADGSSVLAIAKATGLSRQAVYRIKDDPAYAEARMIRWEKTRNTGRN